MSRSIWPCIGRPGRTSSSPNRPRPSATSCSRRRRVWPNSARAEQVIAPLAERDSALQRLAEFEAAAQQTQAAIAEADQRITTLDAQMATTPTRQTTQIQTSENGDLIRRLKAKLLELDLQQTDLLQKFTPDIRRSQQMQAQIDQIRSALTDARGDAGLGRDDRSEPDPPVAARRARAGPIERNAQTGPGAVAGAHDRRVSRQGAASRRRPRPAGGSAAVGEDGAGEPTSCISTSRKRRASPTRSTARALRTCRWPRNRRSRRRRPARAARCCWSWPAWRRSSASC